MGDILQVCTPFFVAMIRCDASLPASARYVHEIFMKFSNALEELLWLTFMHSVTSC